MTREQIIKRYNNYCYSFVKMADLINHLESTHDLDLQDTKDTIWHLLHEMLQNKPDWA